MTWDMLTLFFRPESGIQWENDKKKHEKQKSSNKRRQRRKKPKTAIFRGKKIIPNNHCSFE